MATVEANGTTIHYFDSGVDASGDRPVLLMSHGFLMNHTMFDAQVEALSGEYRCITWDERGFGGTTAPGPFDYWQSAADAMAVLDACGVDQAVLIGMSQGGFLSLRAALAYPNRVKALVMIDSAADVDDAETLAGYEGMLHVMEHGTDAERSDVFNGVAGLILAHDRLNQEWIPIWDALDPGQLVLAGGALLGRDDVSAKLGEITCPVLVVHGLEDHAITIDRALALAGGVADCRGVVEVPGAAHAPNMTHASIVNPALASFLADLNE